MLIKLNREQGITIVISSHLLAEIEKLVSYVGVINKGKLLFQGTLEELKSKQKESLHIIFETNNIEKTLQIFSGIHLTGNIEDGKIVVPSIPKKTIAYLTTQLIENDVEVYEISIVRNDLETIFMNLINN